MAWCISKPAFKSNPSSHSACSHVSIDICALLWSVTSLCQGPGTAEQASGFAVQDSGLAAASQHAVQCGHIAPAPRAGTVQFLTGGAGAEEPCLEPA